MDSICEVLATVSDLAYRWSSLPTEQFIKGLGAIVVIGGIGVLLVRAGAEALARRRGA